jgi:UDP-N-acetylmuramyl tripeptide synthase
VKLGDVFFAYPGDAGDGRSFIESAIEQGGADRARSRRLHLERQVGRLT